jgi:hypothetical protein
VKIEKAKTRALTLSRESGPVSPDDASIGNSALGDVPVMMSTFNDAPIYQKKNKSRKIRLENRNVPTEMSPE